MSAHQICLYVEDIESEAFLLRSATTKAGMAIELKTVQDGEEAIRYLNGDGIYSDRHDYPLPTLMLLDLNLPRKSGFQVLEWLRKQPQLRRMVVIVLTSSHRQEDVDRAHELGANAVLIKPTTIEDLVQMIAQLAAWLELTCKPRIDQR